MELQIIQSKIFEVRGCRVIMFDFYLAEMYQVDYNFGSTTPLAFSEQGVSVTL
jgi:hypothetical protein